MFPSRKLILLLYTTSFVVKGFLGTSHTRTRKRVSLAVYDARTVVLGERYFNLEEMEDQENALTELFLHSDKTVTVGESDGPASSDGTGTWRQLENGNFEMKLTRVYSAGREGAFPSDMGEFEYKVERVFTGDIALSGEVAEIEGTVAFANETIEKKVGFFSMIDTTKERLSREEDTTGESSKSG